MQELRSEKGGLNSGGGVIARHYGIGKRGTGGQCLREGIAPLFASNNDKLSSAICLYTSDNIAISNRKKYVQFKNYMETAQLPPPLM